MNDKYGPYIQKLMIVVLDKTQDRFVRKLAQSELKRLSDNITEFLFKNVEFKLKKKDKPKKQLLQEEK
jgi:hypothetical protein